MEFLSSGGKILKVKGEIGAVLEELRTTFGTRQKAVKAIKDYLRDPESSKIGEILEKAGVDDASFREFLEDNETAITVLFGKIGDLADDKLSWTLDEDKDIGASDWSIDGEVALTASINVDVQEEDEPETSVEELGIELGDQDALTSIGFTGVVSVGGKGEASAPVGGGTLSGALAFDASVEILLENCFLHNRDEEARLALLEDIEDFQLPYKVDSADDLRHMNKGGEVIPTQWVHLKSEGNINFSASLDWGSSWVSQTAVRDKSLDIDETVTVTTGVAASVSASYALTGTFDLVLSASPTAGLVRVSLQKNRSSNRQAGFSLSAGVEIDGLDRVGQALLNKVQPTFDAIVEKVEEEAESLPNLRTLLTDTVDEKVDNLLGSTEVDDDIEKLLTQFGQEIDIAGKLKELAEQKVLDITGDKLDKIDENIEEVQAAVNDLIGRYRALLKKINNGIEKAANLKVSASFSRTWQKISEHEAALVVDIDPLLHKDAYRDLIRGNFAPAIDLFRMGAAGIEIEGKLSESGSLTVTSQLGLNIFGNVLGRSSTRQQDWKLEVSASGDMMLAVKDGFENRNKLWRQTKTFGFMADGRVLDTLAGGVVAGEGRFSPTVTLELGREDMRSTKKAINRYQDDLVRLGVATPPLDIRSDVTLASVSDRDNLLAASVVLELGKDHLDAVLAHGVDEAERKYAAAVIELAVREQGETRRKLRTGDGDGVPAIFWRSVRTELRAPQPGVSQRTFKSDDGKSSVTFDREELAPARMAVIELDRFRTFFSNLEKAQLGVQGKTAQEAREVVRKAQADLVRSAKKLSPEPGYNQAFFRTIFVLARTTGDLDPVAVVTRKKDDMTFMYG